MFYVNIDRIMMSLTITFVYEFEIVSYVLLLWL